MCPSPPGGVSIRAHLPPVIQPPSRSWAQSPGPGAAHPQLPGSAAGTQGRLLSCSRRGRRGSPAGRGRGGSGGTRGRSPQTRPSRSAAAGSQPGPAPPPSSTWDAPEAGAAAKAQTSPPLSPVPERGRAGRCDERGPRLLRRDLGTWGGGWKEHSPSLPAAAAAAPGRGSFLLARLLAPSRPRADSPRAGARGPLAPRPRAAAPRTRSRAAARGEASAW